MKPLLLLDLVGLTPRHIGEHTPCLKKILAGGGTLRPLRGVLPAVTCTAQATLLTGRPPSEHGVVANGWLYHDTMEVRLWQQSRTLLEEATVYDIARLRAEAAGQSFTCAKLFWWFNQGAAADWSVTPKPWYGCDGDKVFGILSHPADFAAELERELGPFPFHTFWGPAAGAACSRWIARAAEKTLLEKRPTLTLVYLPHLDYDLQRHGATCLQLPRLLREVDECAGRVVAAAREIGARTVIVSEYGMTDVRRPVHLNRILRRSGLLLVRDGPFGETIDFHLSRAFAVSDHQAAHVYVRDSEDLERVRALLAATDGVGEVLGDVARNAHGLDHPRAGDLVALAAPDAWFTYYYWLDDASAPDFARTVDIHRKPGYDPCELFYDPARHFPRARAAARLLQKKLGFRTRFDVVPLDATLVRGSHGLPPADPLDGPIFLTDGPGVPAELAMTGVHDYVLQLLEL